MILDPFPIRLNVRALLKHNVKLTHYPTYHTPQLHQTQTLPRTIMRTSRERDKRRSVLDQLWSRGPALRNEFVGTNKVPWVAEQGKQRNVHDCVSGDEVAADFKTLGRDDALGAEEDRRPHAHRLLDDGFEEGEGVFACMGREIGEELGAYRRHVVGVCGEVHEDESQGRRGCFATCGDDEA